MDMISGSYTLTDECIIIIAPAFRFFFRVNLFCQCGYLTLSNSQNSCKKAKEEQMLQKQFLTSINIFVFRIIETDEVIKSLNWKLSGQAFLKVIVKRIFTLGKLNPCANWFDYVFSNKFCYI